MKKNQWDFMHSILILAFGWLLVLPATSTWAVPPLPARIGGSVTVEGILLTQASGAGYTFQVTRPNGTQFTPAAQDMDGLNASGWYLIDVPILEANDQPGGASPGATAVIHVYYYGEERYVALPVNGQITVPGAGSMTQIDINIGTPPADPDADSDGTPDSQDGCPQDAEKLAPGSCGCGVADTDSDSDGVADCDDVYPQDPDRWTDGSGGDQDPNDTGDPDNEAPAQPILMSPSDGEPEVASTVQLQTSEFFDPNPDDGHARSQWQVSTRNDFTTLTAGIDTALALTSLTLPPFVLDGGSVYYWRVRFRDTHGAVSAWSDYSWFTTRSGPEDRFPANGIDDTQEVEADLDLDGNGLPDIHQQDIKCVRTLFGDVRIGVKAAANVTHVDAVGAVDSAILSVKASQPAILDWGVTGFRIKVGDSGRQALVVLYVSDAVPEDAVWYTYDVMAGWTDFSPQTTFGADGQTFSLKLMDGGAGDADGTTNGVIVHLGGVGWQREAQETHAATAAAAGGGGGGGGCFILTAIH